MASRIACSATARAATLLAALVAALFSCAATSRSSRAQSAPEPARLSTLVGAADPATVIDGTYGRLMLERLTGIVAKSASPACLAERKLDRPAIAARLRGHLIDWMRHLNAMTAAAIDSGAFEQALRDAIGELGVAEWRQSLGDPRLSAIREANAAASGVRTLDLAVEYVDRALLLSRVRTSSRLSPLATGDDELLRLSEAIGERAAEAIEANLRQLPPALSERYRSLSETTAATLVNVTPRLWLSFGPRQMVPGVIEHFAALCVASR